MELLMGIVGVVVVVGHTVLALLVLAHLGKDFVGLMEQTLVRVMLVVEAAGLERLVELLAMVVLVWLTQLQEVVFFTLAAAAVLVILPSKAQAAMAVGGLALMEPQ
jgi:hypothetical protein